MPRLRPHSLLVVPVNESVQWGPGFGHFVLVDSQPAIFVLGLLTSLIKDVLELLLQFGTVFTSSSFSQWGSCTPNSVLRPRYHWLSSLVDSVSHHSRFLCLSPGAPWGQGPRGVSYSARTAIIKYYRVCGLNNKSLPFQLWRLEVKTQAEWVSDESSLLSLQIAPSHCILTSSCGIFYEHACKLSERELRNLFLSWLRH